MKLNGVTSRRITGPSLSSLRAKANRHFKALIGLFCLMIILACAGSGSTLGEPALDVSFNPASVNLRPGESQDVQVMVSANMAGIYPLRVNAPGVTVSPANFTATFDTGLTPVVQVLTITAPAGNSAGNYTLEIGDVLKVYGSMAIAINDGTPDFAITASRELVSVQNNVMSDDVDFTVTSLNGYTGTIKITWVADGDVSPSPSDNDFTGTVSPTAPFKFKRKMYRYATHGDDIPLVFNATDVPYTKQRSVTVTIRRLP